MDKNIFIVMLLILLLCYSKSSAQECKFNGNIVNAYCKTEVHATSWSNWYYFESPVAYATHIAEMVYKEYTSLFKRKMSGNIQIYLVWTKTVDKYGNKEKIEKNIGSINLENMRKYQDAKHFVNSPEVKAAMGNSLNNNIFNYKKELARVRTPDLGKSPEYYNQNR